MMRVMHLLLLYCRLCYKDLSVMLFELQIALYMDHPTTVFCLFKRIARKYEMMAFLFYLSKTTLKYLMPNLTYIIFSNK